jgi:DNA-binding NarL/FixJ family response regulator
MDPLRVLIADDHPLFRKGMTALLGAVEGIEVVGVATTGEEAVARTVDLQPELVLMDLQMPGGGGIAATREIRHAAPAVRILVVTLFEDDDSVFLALRAGAHGYVLKEAGEDEMLRAIRGTARGEAIFSPAVAARVLSYFAAPRPTAPPQAFPTLTEREREILTLIARGRPNPAIARELGIAPKTVGNHVSNIFGKLQVADRAEAIIRAREAGLGID